MSTAIAPPRGLKPRSRKVWKSVLGEYQLRADELDILEDICRTMDLIDTLEAELEGAPLTVLGSQRQEVVNPMIAELRQHRATKKSLWASLKLKDTSAGEINHQREGGFSRWATHYGK